MIAACVKWTDLRPEIDQLHGSVEQANHGAGFSEPDRAAVEVALRLGAARDAAVTVVCVGPADADDGLRELLAVGVDRVVRIEGDGTESSVDVATRLAVLLRDEASDTADLLVVCGDLSADRGSGSVPAFLAHELGAAQALGLIEVDTATAPLQALRRLDGGRRERLGVPTPAVISVEGAVADLRRAPLAALLRTGGATVEVRPARSRRFTEAPRLRPWRPRARVVPPPRGDTALERIVHLTGALVERTPPTAVELAPDEAATAILDQLRVWGYLDPPDR